MIALSSEVRNFKETLDPIIKAMRGDGLNPSLPTIVAVLQGKIEYVAEHVNACRTKMDSMENHLRQKMELIDAKMTAVEKTDKQGHFMVWTAVISGVAGVIGAIIVAVIQFFKHTPHGP